MKQVFKCEYQQIGISLEPKVVRIDNYEHLDNYLKQHKSAIKMANDIKEQYKDKFNKPLAITTKSLATEIKGHYNVKKYCIAFQHKCPLLIKIKLINKLVNSLIDHCDVIDCGEISCDNNRWIWDLLQIFAR